MVRRIDRVIFKHSAENLTPLLQFCLLLMCLVILGNSFNFLCYNFLISIMRVITDFSGLCEEYLINAYKSLENIKCSINIKWN